MELFTKLNENITVDIVYRGIPEDPDNNYFFVLQEDNLKTFIYLTPEVCENLVKFVTEFEEWRKNH